VARLLNHRDPIVRQRAVRVFAKLAPGDLREVFRRLLSDPSWAVRVEALKVLRIAHHRGAVDLAAVRQMLSTSMRSTTWQVREAAVLAAHAIAPRQARDLLRAGVEDANGYVRQAAVSALGALRDPRSRALLVSTLKDRSPWVRAAACEALVRSPHPAARGLLLPLLDDPSQKVRRAAQDALKRIHAPPSAD
jgi:HEAT repeat protein